MYTQFFGNYLLNKGAITREQLLDALEKQSTTHMKLGALAIHEGYMTASEVEQVFILQTHEDKRFGQLAVENGYLSQEQIDDLLQKQLPEFILLGQILVDQGILTPTQLENLVTDYRSEYEIYDLDLNQTQKELIIHLLEDITIEDDQFYQYIIDYLLLLFNNLIRFIGDDFTALSIMEMSEVATNCCTSQDLECPLFHVASVLDMKQEVAIAFASRYAKEEFTEPDEYVRASLEDFLNLHNGLFVVNMSNEYAMEISLLPPTSQDNGVFAPENNTYLFPILYPFGIIYFIFSAYKTVEPT